jgi:ketosteroid isomerase-like protein
MITAESIFSRVDRQDVTGLIELLAEDATMVFGNAEPLRGREAILAGNRGFLQTIKGLRHSITEVWTVGATTVAVTDVTYTRRDDKEVTIPCVSIWRVGDDGLIVDYRIFFDPSPIYAT